MLTHLHVKNLALIREAEIDFTEGLNILTGETGAGKSIVIGSVSLALGGKAPREMVRPGAEYGLAELVFLVNRGKQKEKLLELGIVPEEDQVIISRKISDGRSINKINGETVTLSQLKEAASLLIDIHGQHEHQSLLQKKKHLEILDEFAKEELALVKESLAGEYRSWKELKKQLSEAQMDEESRLREISLLEFETGEIERAELSEGEDEELERRYRRMTNARRLLEAAGNAYALTGYEEETGAGAVIGRAIRELQSVLSFDEELSALASQLSDVDGLLNDFNRELSDYLSSLEFDEEEFAETLDLVRKVGYMQLFTFIYSKRSGTKAAEMPDPYTHADKTARMERLLRTQDEIAFPAIAAMAGRTERVLVEACGRTPGTLNGRLDNNLVVEFPGDESLIGQWAEVKLTGSRAALLTGEKV